MEHADQTRDGVLGKMRIGGVALAARHADRAGQAAAPADLHGVAEARHRGRFADQRGVEAVAFAKRPVDELDCAVDRRAFLVAGDEQRQGADRFAPRSQELRCRGEERGDAALHVDRPAAVEVAVGDLSAKGRMAPALGIAGRHDVGVAGKDQMRRPRADRGKQILDVGGARVRKHQSLRLKPGRSENIGEQVQRAALGRRHRGAGDEGLEAGNGVDEGLGHDADVDSRLRLVNRIGRLASDRRRSGRSCRG